MPLQQAGLEEGKQRAKKLDLGHEKLYDGPLWMNGGED